MSIDLSKISFIFGSSVSCKGDLTCYRSIISLTSINELKFFLTHGLSHYKLNHFTKLSVIMTVFYAFIFSYKFFNSYMKTYVFCSIIGTTIATLI